MNPKEIWIKIKSLFSSEGQDQAIDGQKRLGEEVRKTGQEAEKAGEQTAAAHQRAGQSGEEAAGKTQGALGRVRSMWGRLNEATGGWANTVAAAAGKVFLVFKGIQAAVQAIAGAFRAAARAVQEFAAHEQAVTRLDAALARQGQLTRAYRLELQGLASEMQDVTGIGDGEWIQVMERLTNLYGASSDNIEEMTGRVADLAGTMGVDLMTATRLYGQALEGQLDLFRRYGIIASDIDQLHQQIAGGQRILEATTRTITGRWRDFSNQVSDVWKGLGNLISRTGVVQGALSGLSSMLRVVNRVLPETTRQVDGLENSIKDLDTELENVRRKFHEVEEAAGGIFKTAREAVEHYKEAIAGAVGELEKLQQREDERADAEMALRLEEINLREASGEISPEQARIERLGERAAAEQRQIQNDLRVAETALQAQQEQASQAVTAEFAARTRADVIGEQVAPLLARVGLPEFADAAKVRQRQDDLRAQLQQAEEARLGSGPGADAARLLSTEMQDKTFGVTEEIQTLRDQLAAAEELGTIINAHVEAREEAERAIASLDKAETKLNEQTMELARARELAATRQETITKQLDAAHAALARSNQAAVEKAEREADERGKADRERARVAGLQERLADLQHKLAGLAENEIDARETLILKIAETEAELVPASAPHRESQQARIREAAQRRAEQERERDRQRRLDELHRQEPEEATGRPSRVREGTPRETIGPDTFRPRIDTSPQIDLSAQAGEAEAAADAVVAEVADLGRAYTGKFNDLLRTVQQVKAEVDRLRTDIV